MERLTRPARRIRLVVDCESSEQFLDLLAFTKSLGLSPQVGQANGVDHTNLEPRERDIEPLHSDDDAVATRRAHWREQKRRERSAGRPAYYRTPRYPSSSLIKVTNKDVSGRVPPKALAVLQALKNEYGTRAFVKGDTKERVLAPLGVRHSTGLITKLLDAGALRIVDANPTPQSVALLLPRGITPGSARAKDRERRIAKGSFRPKPKRYPPHLMVRVSGKEPEGVRPRARDVLKAIKDEFGDKPFKKGDVKAAVLKKLPRMGSATGYVTILMDSGALEPAPSA